MGFELESFVTIDDDDDGVIYRVESVGRFEYASRYTENVYSILGITDPDRSSYVTEEGLSVSPDPPPDVRDEIERIRREIEKAEGLVRVIIEGARNRREEEKEEDIRAEKVGTRETGLPVVRTSGNLAARIGDEVFLIEARAYERGLRTAEKLAERRR